VSSEKLLLLPHVEGSQLRQLLAAATPYPHPHLRSTSPLTLARWAEEFEQAYTFVTDPTGAAQEAAASGEGGSDAPAVVWRTYPEEWIVATKPKIGPPRQVCGVVSARVVSEMGDSVWCLSAYRAAYSHPHPTRSRAWQSGHRKRSSRRRSRRRARGAEACWTPSGWGTCSELSAACRVLVW